MSNITTTDIAGAQLMCGGETHSVESLFIAFNLKARAFKKSVRELLEEEFECIEDGALADELLEELAEDGNAYNNVRDWRAYCNYARTAYTLLEIFNMVDMETVKMLEEAGVSFESALKIAFIASHGFSCGYGAYFLENQGWRARSVKRVDIYNGLRNDVMSIDSQCFYIANAGITIRIELDCGWETEGDIVMTRI